MMGQWVEEKRRGQGWMDGGVGLEKEEGAGLDGWESEVRVRRGSRARWMGK